MKGGLYLYVEADRLNKKYDLGFVMAGDRAFVLYVPVV